MRKSKDYTVIATSSCPNCGSKEQKVYERTKGEIKYIVYVCSGCKNVIRRELS
nr:MAG TPA: transcription factor IIS-like protein [Caudoviricetes sp.]